MGFCNAFDEQLALTGPAAVFLRDHEGLWRFEAGWTRTAWENTPGPHEPGHRWVHVCDHATGFVTCVLVTSPTLMATHPRGDITVFEDEDEAWAALDALGTPPVRRKTSC